ncbi:hypothetical protein LCGC14_1501340 [marine sediment metagenome]|uniref:Sulfatase N-terminal domain-containing protein n=1 Tax=marine sediment metagenome TaxID=412755 RepID=A0A0F9J4I0_9ZZZZ
MAGPITRWRYKRRQRRAVRAITAKYDAAETSLRTQGWKRPTGDANAITPNIDRLAGRSVNFVNAVAGCPVCCPYRASLLTGRFPLTHGVFTNDVHLGNDAVSIARAYAAGGYDTGYIGKWHVDGHGRSALIPKDRRQGFDYWKVLECTHNYNRSAYYGDEDVKRFWDGYDAIAQTRDACGYIRDHAGAKPFALMLSWGPPHAPYHTAPEKYRKLFEGRTLKLRPNVPERFHAQAAKDLAGYYAHIAALDDCVGMLVDALDRAGIADDTLLVLTSDHGDMLYSQGQVKKQQPYDESIRVPFLLRYPALLGAKGRTFDTPIDAPDIMPTLLGLCGIDVPATVEGTDFSPAVRGASAPANDAVLITCPDPFGQWPRAKGGREYRGVRTARHTYVRTLEGPWLLFDNAKDPYQQDNLVDRPEHKAIQQQLEAILTRKLTETKDRFRPGAEYIKKWGYTVDETGTVPYKQ